MKGLLISAAMLLVATAPAWASESFPARGLVLKVDKPKKFLVISCERIPGYMDAMVMSFPVHNGGELAAVDAGAMIEFTLVVGQDDSYIEKIRVHHYEGVEQDPISARRLKLLASVVNPASTSGEIKVGEHVPDFSLTDQSGQTVSLSQLSGKVVAITFTYTHCALPNFCFRIANSFRALQKHFAGQMGSDLILLTITFDPAHDTPDVMAKYGKTWETDPASWKLLSGTTAEIEELCRKFGISSWPEEGLMIHSLHTFVVDRKGNLVANLEGNEFSTNQLNDLVQTVMERQN